MTGFYAYANMYTFYKFTNVMILVGTKPAE